MGQFDAGAGDRPADLGDRPGGAPQRARRRRAEHRGRRLRRRRQGLRAAARGRRRGPRGVHPLRAARRRAQARAVDPGVGAGVQRGAAGAVRARAAPARLLRRPRDLVRPQRHLARPRRGAARLAVGGLRAAQPRRRAAGGAVAGGGRAAAGRRALRAPPHPHRRRDRPLTAPADVSAAERGATAEWRKCPSCGAYVYHKRLKRQLGVCPECNHHFRIRLRERLEQLLDPGSLERAGRRSGAAGRARVRRFQALRGADRRAPRRAARSRARSTGRATIGDLPLVLAGIDFGFIGGSLGSAEGEAITLAAELALAERTPLLVISRLRRRAHAGGRRLADADGQDLARRWPGCARRASSTSRC